MNRILEPSYIKTLRWTPLLSVLNDEQFEYLLANAQIVEYGLAEPIDYCNQTNPSLCILLSGSARLAENEPGSNQTLYIIKETGSFFSSELPRRAGIPAPLLIGSDNPSFLRLDGTAFTALMSQSDKLVEKLEHEASIFHCFTRLRSTPRFDALDYWRFRPILSQASVLRFSDAERFDNAKTAEGLFILLAGIVQSGPLAKPVILQAGDWFARGKVLASHALESAQAFAINKGEMIHITSEAYTKLEEFSPELLSYLDLLLLATPNKDKARIDSASNILAQIPAGELKVQEDDPPVSEEEEPLAPKLRRKLKKYPVIYQHSELECAITCLHMVCLFYGQKVSLTKLRELCEIGRSGSSMLELAEAAEQLGFVTRGVRTTYTGLSRLRLPIILFWKRNHFVVLYEINSEFALIGDPGEGLVRVEREKFQRDFSEHALELSPTVKYFKQKSETENIWQSFLPFLRPHCGLIRDVLICSALFEILLLVAPIFTQVVLDQVIVHQDLDTLNILLVGMLLMSAFQTVMGYLRQYFLAFLSLKTDQGLFTELLQRLLSLPLDYFNKHSTGDTLTRFGESAGVVQFLTGIGAMTVLDLFMALAYMCVIFFYNATFGWITFAYVAVLFFSILLCTPLLRKLSQRAYDKQIAAESFLVEAVRGIEKVKSAAAERRTRWKWESLFLEKLNVRFQESLAISAISAAARLLQLLGQIYFLWLGAQMVISKELTIGQLMALTMLVSMIVQPFMRLAELSQYFQAMSVAMERLAEVLLEKPEEADPQAKLQLAGVEGLIKFDNVRYIYPGREGANALNNISFEARPGQMIGIVGRSGSGKSTLTKLIQGLYCPAEGRIYVDGNDLAQVSLPSYRRRIGVVSQSEYFFRGTVRENIAFYKPDAPLQEIIAAATIAGINDLISSLPSGYESVLNEGAENFSGGQRQCMAIARAILHEPKILIFDEATSAMDSESERLIQECMERLRAQCTMFVVAHRLSTVTSADQILVLDEGHLVESGTHESLMQSRGLYYYLCKKQALIVM